MSDSAPTYPTIEDVIGATPLVRLVPRVGIEPTLLAERDFESRASTNFATEAGACSKGQFAIRAVD